MAIPRNFAKMLKPRVKKAIDCSRILLIIKDYQGLECLSSRWSVESHMFIAA